MISVRHAASNATDSSTATVDGVPHAVTGGQDGTVRLWNLATGQQVGKPLLDHGRAISAAATTTIDGIPHALAGAGDGKLRLWNLATGGRAGKPLAAHDAIWAVASTTVDGAPHAVWRVWDSHGRLRSESEWDRGVPCGRWVTWDADGQLERVDVKGDARPDDALVVLATTASARETLPV